MRAQQINLYQPIFRKQAVAFSFNVMLGMFLLLVVLMAAVYGVGQWQTENLIKHSRDLQVQHDALEQQVSDMAKKLPKPTRNKLLEGELERLVAKRKSGFALLNTLQTRIAANKEGYSGYFEGLARQAFPEIWLTHISVTGSGEALSLRGRTLYPDGIPKLLKRLETEAAFAGKSFQIVQLGQADDQDQALTFKLLTSGGEESE